MAVVVAGRAELSVSSIAVDSHQAKRVASLKVD
jgi:hypothetical protein